MIKVIKDRFPEWCNNKGNYALTLTDDLDSLLSCAILHQLFGYEINQFYSFKTLYSVDQSISKEHIGVDLDIMQGKTWSNHVTRVHNHDWVNPDAANLNTLMHVSTDNYFKKYAGSTVLTLYAYYDLPLPVSIEGKRLLLAIDSAYLGHYRNSFNTIHTKWLEAMGLNGLIDTLNQTDEKEFNWLNSAYHLKDKIYIDQKGFLYANINQNIQTIFLHNFDLPSLKFQVQSKFKTYQDTAHSLNYDKLFSCAVTGRNKIKYSIQETEQ